MRYFSSTNLNDLADEIESSGVSVQYCSAKFIKKLELDWSDKNCHNIPPAGIYLNLTPKDGVSLSDIPDSMLSLVKLLRNTIFIDKNLPNYRKCVTLLHEYGHCRCFLSRCNCELINKADREFHAMRYSLTEMLQRDYLNPLFAEITNICSQLADKESYYYHACRKIIRDPIWIQCRSLFWDKLEPWMLKHYGYINCNMPRKKWKFQQHCIAKYVMPELTEAQGRLSIEP